MTQTGPKIDDLSNAREEIRKRLGQLEEPSRGEIENYI